MGFAFRPQKLFKKKKMMMMMMMINCIVTRPTLKITQGCFSFLPDLSDESIYSLMSFCIGRGWSMSLEYTDYPHPRCSYWDMWGLPLFGETGPDRVFEELRKAKEAYPNSYIKLNAFDASYGVESCVMSFIVNRPSREPRLVLQRSEGEGRKIGYAMEFAGYPWFGSDSGRKEPWFGSDSGKKDPWFGSDSGKKDPRVM